MVEKAKETHAIEEIKEKFKTLLTDIKSLDMKDLKDFSLEYYEDIKSALHVEEIQDSFNDNVDALEKAIRKKPLKSALVATGIGFLMAKIFRF